MCERGGVSSDNASGAPPTSRRTRQSCCQFHWASRRGTKLRRTVRESFIVSSLLKTARSIHRACLTPSARGHRGPCDRVVVAVDGGGQALPVGEQSKNGRL